MLCSSLVYNALIFGLGAASVLPVRDKSSDCSHGPSYRQCWDGDFNIDTDHTGSWPTTGKTVKVLPSMPVCHRAAPAPRPGAGTVPPHPIHLHGHDFYLLGAGSGNFSGAATSNFKIPPRRDVAMLQGGDYLVLGFQTDNPGAWLMHCHIAWHVGEGFGVQFLERASKIQDTFSLDSLEPTCSEWNSWYKTDAYQRPGSDSGL